MESDQQLEVLLKNYRKSNGLFFGVHHNRSRENDKSGHFGLSSPMPMFVMKDYIEFCGIPFSSECTTVRDCMFGKDDKQKRYEKQDVRTLDEHGYQKPVIKEKTRIQNSKK